MFSRAMRMDGGDRKEGVFVTMAVIWTGMVLLSVVFGILNGKGEALASAVLSGAADAVSLAVAMAGLLCLWMGVMEVMRRSGLAGKLARLLRPLLGRLYPEFRRDDGVMESVSANVSANLLGLGNAATPLGIEAARRMNERSGMQGTACDGLCMLVVCNTASIQLIPTTVAGVRAAAGCAAPFDILPAVWLASLCSVTAGICAAKLFAVLWRRRE